MDTPNCNRCGTVRDTTDNFCRKCGHQLTIDVPAVRPVTAVQPTANPINVSIPPSVVRGVAVLALSTGVEWMLRRMAGNAAKAAGRSLIPGTGTPAKQLKDGGPREVTVDEFLYVRKVQLRR